MTLDLCVLSWIIHKMEFTKWTFRDVDCAILSNREYMFHFKLQVCVGRPKSRRHVDLAAGH